MLHLPFRDHVVGEPVAPLVRREVTAEVTEVDLDETDRIERDVETPKVEALKSRPLQPVAVRLLCVGGQHLSLEVHWRQVVQPAVVLVEVRAELIGVAGVPKWLSSGGVDAVDELWVLNACTALFHPRQAACPRTADQVLTQQAGEPSVVGVGALAAGNEVEARPLVAELVIDSVEACRAGLRYNVNLHDGVPATCEEELTELQRTHLDNPVLPFDLSAHKFLGSARLVQVRPSVADRVGVEVPQERVREVEYRVSRDFS